MPDALWLALVAFGVAGSAAWCAVRDARVLADCERRVAKLEAAARGEVGAECREQFQRALDRLLLAQGEWARCRSHVNEAERDRLAEVAAAAERTVMDLYAQACRAAPEPGSAG